VNRSKTSQREPIIPPERVVHLYQGRLDLPDGQVNEFRDDLTAEERSLIDRRVTPELRRRATVSRGLLRHCLGTALEIAPSSVTINSGKHGKPILGDPKDAASLSFNLSHTAELWILAIAPANRIGVDIETQREETDWDSLVSRYFSTREAQDFNRLLPNQRKESFFRTWCAKEAFLKARGTGLATPLAAFDVEVDPEQPLRLHDVRLEGESAEDWWICPIDGLDVPGAVAGRGREPSVERFTLPI